MGKGTDKLYITHSEHASGGGYSATTSGAKSKKSSSAFQRLPFDTCALSLKPFDNPVCTRDGTVYDLINIIPYIRKHGTDPVTGKKLGSGDLIKLTFHKNPQGQYFDPVSYKTFNEHTALVAIANTGNVFTKDTIDQLNAKPQFWRDLVTDEEFTRKDLITLQDPHNLDQRDLSKFHYLKNEISVPEADESAKSESVGKDEPKAKPAPVATIDKGKSKASDSDAIPYNATVHSTGRAAASLTSTSMDVQTKTERALIDEEEYMFERMLPGEKGYVAMKTNLGTINLELHCDHAPKTCYNFLELSKTGKYDNTIFHRLIPGFMIQGGDPTGTGRGGASIWGTPFRDEYKLRHAHRHESRGCLSMANSGADSNGSQFFLTFRETAHLNNKHTVFGRVVGGEEVLARMEGVPVQPSTDRPTKIIRLLDITIYKNPYDEFKTKLEKRLAREAEARDANSTKAKRKAERELDRTTWFGTQVGEKDQGQGVEKNIVGKYLSGAATAKNGNVTAADTEKVPEDVGTASKKVKRKGEFGDFSGW